MSRAGTGRMLRLPAMSLRVRLVVLGVAGLAVGLGVGAVALVLALGYTLERTVSDEAHRTAADVAALVNEGALPEPVPLAGEHLVQVVDAEHRVRSASINADRLLPLLREPELLAARQGEELDVRGDRVGLAGPLRVVALAAGTPADPQTVIVARPIGEQLHTVALLRTALLLAYPPLLVGLAALGWRIVGAALRPVEALRTGAERITGSATEERLPVPPAQDEIARLAVTLNGMLDRLAAARARQRTFVGDAAHELRSPLASMRTQLEVAQRLGEGGPLTADLLMDVERLSQLVNDLLLLARADEMLPPAHREPVELRSLLDQAAERRADARVPVRVVNGEPLWTLGEPDALRRAVDNLVENGVRHARSEVVLDVAAEGAYHLLTVADDGPGVPPADRQRVFERFTRLDDARARDGGGAGLGLAIVLQLVRRHGGAVELADVFSGTRVEVRLPTEQSLTLSE